MDKFFKEARPLVECFTDRSVANPMLQFSRASEEANTLEAILLEAIKPLSPNTTSGNHLCFAISARQLNWPDDKKLVVQFSGFFVTIGIGLVNGITNMCIDEVWDSGVFSINAEAVVKGLSYNYKQAAMNHLRMDIVPAADDLADLLVKQATVTRKAEGLNTKYFAPSIFEMGMGDARLVVSYYGGQIGFGPKVDI